MTIHETFIVLALPHTARAEARRHLSLFIAPRLLTDERGTQLREFERFSRWGALLADAGLRLRNQNGAIEARLMLRQLDVDLWERIFNPETPVQQQEVPQWQNRRLHSFDTRTVATLAKGVQAASILASPTAPPLPDEHPLTAPMGRFVTPFIRRDPRYGKPRGDDEQRFTYDESLATAALDDWLLGNDSLRVDGRIANLNEDVASADLLPARMAAELHKVRRFYERPESVQEYRERPDPEAKAEPLPPLEPEFHQRCASLGDHPELLRRLGLVIDVVVDDVTELARSSVLVADLDVAGLRGVRTRVQCAALSDDSMVTTGEGDYADGLLALGDRERFAVLDVDTDGAALKTERYFWSLPRMSKIQSNGDGIDAASPALRSSGFTVARTQITRGVRDRLTSQTNYFASLTPDSTELDHLLGSEDVTRGYRVEVFDAETGKWRSLHRRRTDVFVRGELQVQDLENEGFLQGAAATETPNAPATAPVYVHEALFGWEGWSLSAPRPGKRIRKASPEELAADPTKPEIVEDVTETPVPGDQEQPHPFHFVHRAEPGSLPRLRYGRSYAFRAWQVDLAGNSRPHELAPERGVDPARVAGDVQRLLATVGDGAPLWSRALRDVTASSLAQTASTKPGPASAVLRQPDGVPAVGDVLPLLAGSRALRQRVRDVPGVRVTRDSLLRGWAADAVRDQDSPLIRDTASLDARRISTALSLHAAALGGLAAAAVASMTRLRPFLRWDPVQPPALVPRVIYTEGESLRVLVIRSGVSQDAETGAITVTAPAEYAAEVAASRPGLVQYAADTQRHLVPPKVTQMTAELHGKFDVGIGASPAERAEADRMLAWALTEDGSLLDRDRADLDNPALRIEQPGVALVTSSAVPQVTEKSLPPLPGEPPPDGEIVGVGDAPAPGQYVVHDTDELTLPYLPDPLAEGVSFVFPDAGRDRNLPFPFAGEGFTAAYRGDWPRVEPYRLVLRGADQLSGSVEGRVVHFDLPPGDRQKLRVSSSLTPDALELLGPWHSVSAKFSGRPEVAEAARDGWFWGLSPSEEMILVHAVPRPLEVPRPTSLKIVRFPDSTSAFLIGGIDLHGPSTDLLSMEGTWQQPVDDLAAPGPTSQQQFEVAATTRIRESEDIAIVAGFESVGSWPGVGPVVAHALNHEFPDTKHRKVTYQFRASSRFREYFHPELLAPAADNPKDDGKSLLSAPVVLDVPSSARPAPPVVHSVIPLFRWERGTEPEQPLARRHVRRAGVRIYLERPWFSSGEGELLAVLLAPDPDRREGPLFTGNDAFGPASPDDSGFPFVSKIGADPIWFSSPVHERALQPLAVADFFSHLGFDDRTEPAYPVARPQGTFELPAFKSTYPVRVAGYRPEYNPERKLWFVDVALEVENTAWSFVRLAVARYQPSSVGQLHLSEPVRCDFVQLPPERTASVSRTDADGVRVVVSGPVGLRRPAERDSTPEQAVNANRRLVARLQQRDPDVPTDLGWITRATEDLVLRSVDQASFVCAWSAELTSPTAIDVQRPEADESQPSQWRVLIEEYESFPGDPLPPRTGGGPGAIFGRLPVWEERLVYADEFSL